MEAQMHAAARRPTAEPDDRRRVNSVQAAEIAGVTERTIYNWMRSGKIEVVRTAGGRVRIYADTLLLPDRRYV